MGFFSESFSGAVVVVTLLHTGLAAIPVYAPFEPVLPAPRILYSIAAEPNDELVIIGGQSSHMHQEFDWRWDGEHWTPEVSAVPKGTGTSIVYDSRRERQLLFGGSDGWAIYSEFLQYQNGNWKQINTPTGPSPRQFAGMAYDSDRDRVVHYGGWPGPDAIQPFDTWEFDGISWTEIPTLHHPLYYRTVQLAYDNVRNEVVGLVSVRTDDTEEMQTWTYDGVDWTQRATGGPEYRDYFSLCWDEPRGVVMLFGGSDTRGNAQLEPEIFYGDTWTWDGETWQKVSETGPGPRSSAPLTYLRESQEVLLYGGRTVYEQFGVSSMEFLTDMWRWNGSQWTLVGYTSPSAALDTSGVYDTGRDRLVVYVANNHLNSLMPYVSELWEWDGGLWQLRSSGEIQSLRWPGMVYDSAREEVVLFGGLHPLETPYSEVTDDTWTWDGDTWTLAAEGGPPARSSHAMAYDPVRDRTVMFGGSVKEDYDEFEDTWEWDGQQWELISTEGPQERRGANMTYDAALNRVLLFGGVDTEMSGHTNFNDVWAWDGSSWTQLAFDFSPDERRATGFAHEAASGKTWLFAGAQGSVYYSDLWSMDGRNWMRLKGNTVLDRSGCVLADSPRPGELLMYGGNNPSLAFQDLWRLVVDIQPENWTIY
jgi:hypothetical protein